MINIEKNRCNVYVSFPYSPYSAEDTEYRCGNCFHFFGNSLYFRKIYPESLGWNETNRYLKCPECGYINDMKESVSKSDLKMTDYPRIIKKIESEIKIIEEKKE